MNKLYSVFAFLAFAANLLAQITVTSATFPAAGDTLKYATDLSPSGVAITPAGGPATWDFTSLAPNVNSETVFQAANTGTAFGEFPTATLVSIGAGGQSETYYSADATGFYNLGFYGSDPTGGGLPVQTAFHFTPPVPERRSPMNFFDFNQAESSLNIAFSVADLGPLADSLGPLAGLADSIRIRGVATRIDLVDSYGSLSIPGGTYDVLREKRSEYRETRLDIHTFLGWQDITDLVLGGAGGGIAEGLGKDTVVTYVFMSNTEKEVIASVNAGSDGQTPQSVEYKDNGIPNAVGDVLGAAQQVSVSPNPAADRAVFSLKNLAPDNY
ncbi:MAG: hypothetical protein IT258_15590 [Saprospiraceae bacterium]|nr:hypothetical protein [Saprospiraceae bacterium]